MTPVPVAVRTASVRLGEEVCVEDALWEEEEMAVEVMEAAGRWG